MRQTLEAVMTTRGRLRRWRISVVAQPGRSDPPRYILSIPLDELADPKSSQHAVAGVRASFWDETVKQSECV